MHDGKITVDTVITVADDLMVADFDGEAVVLSLHRGAYFGLNEVGTRAFELARRPRPVRALVDAMLQEYDAEREELAGDLLRFLAEMREAGLIVTGGVGADGTAP
jgi:hypothetical protein